MKFCSFYVIGMVLFVQIAVFADKESKVLADNGGTISDREKRRAVDNVNTENAGLGKNLWLILTLGVVFLVVGIIILAKEMTNLNDCETEEGGIPRRREKDNSKCFEAVCETFCCCCEMLA